MISEASGPEPPAGALTGELQLGVERRCAAVNGAAERRSRSIIVSQRHAGALRVLRPHYPDGPASGQPALTVVNPGGGYLGGDRYLMRVGVGDAAGLTLTTQSATKVYRTPQGPACMVQRFDLGAGARLEFVPDSLIAYRGASYLQRTEIEMHPSASLVLAEVVTHGWSPDGTPFAFDRITVSTRVAVGGVPAAIDRLRIAPADGGIGRLMLGGFSHLAALLVVDPRTDDAAVETLRDVLDVRGSTADRLLGITRLGVPGFALRALTHSTPAADAILRAAIDWMRAEWHSLPPLSLRKP